MEMYVNETEIVENMATSILIVSIGGGGDVTLSSVHPTVKIYPGMYAHVAIKRIRETILFIHENVNRCISD